MNRLLFRGVLFACMLASAFQVQALDEQTEKRLQRLERRVGHITEIMLEMQALRRTNSALQGQVEELQHALERLRRKQQELYLDLDERIGQAAAPGVSVDEPAASTEAADQPSLAPEPAVAVENVDEPAQSADPGQIKKDYEQAYALLQPGQRRYQEAIRAFNAFLQKYPTNDYTDNALYWLGEAYYVSQNNTSALAAFDQLLQQFPNSRKAPGAMLKKGYILDALGQREQAVQVLKQVIQRYPDSSVANMARARLKHMKKKS